MYKALFICALLLAATAVNVKKSHKNVHGHNKHHKKTLSNKGAFHSASFEFVNVGEADYHLDEKVSKHWDQVTKKYVSAEENQSNSFVEVEAYEQESTLGEIIDLSNNAGVISYTVTDEQGNVIDEASGPELSAKMMAQLEATYSTEEKSSFLQQEEKGEAMVKLETDMDNIIREDQQEAAAQEEAREQALEGTVAGQEEQ